MNPYVLMAVLYLSLAALDVVVTILVGLELLPAFNGLKWLRVHLITLGGLAQLAFGLLPELAARLSGVKPPRLRWDIWLALNLGLLILLVGIPMVNALLVISGGTLVFIAAGLLALHLGQVGRAGSGRRGQPQPVDVRPFYLAALGYLLVGVLAGTGLWFGWGEALQMAAPIEVHVHSNLWGFTALLLAGLVTQLYPGLAGTPLAWPRLVRPIFWGLALGALGLVVGPWAGLNLVTAGGLALHSLAMLALVVTWAYPLAKKRAPRTPGMAHVITAYAWFFGPAVVAPLIVFRLGDAASEIAGSGGPILIYGWILPILYALLPYLLGRWLRPERPAQPGGTWLSLLVVQAGSVLFWLSLFWPEAATALRAAAYTLWLGSLGPVLFGLWHEVRQAAHSLIRPIT